MLITEKHLTILRVLVEDRLTAIEIQRRTRGVIGRREIHPYLQGLHRVGAVGSRHVEVLGKRMRVYHLRPTGWRAVDAAEFLKNLSPTRGMRNHG